LQHGADVGNLDFLVVLFNLLPNNAANFVWSNADHFSC
jgi:hypothetical protein